ncbi:hypothetical protein BC940DRAFT_330577 [Gongronella butleri]|nr:hypothetical protein BC940DRAFT_330577 [Gongronella butleri]
MLKQSLVVLCLLYLCVCFGVHLKSSTQEGKDFVENVLLPETSDYCKPFGQIKDTCCDYQSVESIQGDTFAKVQSLVKTNFFKYYKLNLWRECPFWQDNGLCMNRDCAVETTDESLLPEEWRQDALGALKMLSSPSKYAHTVYVNLLDNPERFTGYSGDSATKVWKAIYEENCFNIVSQMAEGCPTCAAQMPSLASLTSTPVELKLAPAPSNKAELDILLDDLAGTPDNANEVCLEKRVYYRLISGLHSSISIHICDEYFDRSTGTWGPNLQCFVNRIGTHPERLQNIYFTYALVVRAIAKLEDYLVEYPFKTGDNAEDARTRMMVQDLIKSTRECPLTFDEKSMFQGDHARSLYVEFRDHFRNVSRIMDCVGCEKCRLWGKVQITGLGAALKVLFAYEEQNLRYTSNPTLLQRDVAKRYDGNGMDY